MEIGLIIFGAFLLILPGIWGIRHGIGSSLFALTGTLLAAVLVTLWGSWIRERTGSNDGMGMGLAAISGVFLAIAFIVGYGGNAVFTRPPKPGPSGEPAPLKNRVLGGLLGVLNGLLIFSFLLRYAVDLGNPDISAVVGAASVLWLWIVYTWLPWYILAVSVIVSIWIIARLLVRLIRNLTIRQPASTQRPTYTAAYTEQPAKTKQLQGISSKIDQALDDQSRRR